MRVSRGNPVLKGLGASALILLLTACNNGSPTQTTTTSTGTTTSTPLGQADFTGTYVFSVAGTDPTDGDYFVAGSFVADGKGGISSGIADYNLGSGIDSSVPLTGSYTVSAGVASVKITDSGSVTDTFSAPVVKTGSSALSNFDGTGTGTMYAQASGFMPAGNYSYTLKGEGQGTVTGSGQFVVGAAQTFTSGNLTYTDGSTTTTASPIAGFLLSPETNGRGQGFIAGNDFSYYPVTSSQIVLLGIDDRTLLAATAQKQ